MTVDIRLPSATIPAEAEELRREVRSFLAAAEFEPQCDSFMRGISPEFSRSLGERGWLGMTWPRRYGGQERSNLERYVVIEELLAAGAPVAAHWIAERQTGPLLLRFGTEEQRRLVMPAIARGECWVSIGMSEPDTGSDLASVRTHAARDGDGWRLNGTKIWSSHATYCHYMVALVRTAPSNGDRHAGLSQLLIDLKTPGLSIRPIQLMTGEPHFSEVHFADTFIAGDMLIGTEGDGWTQVVSELAIERSGPERFMSTFPLLVELARLWESDRSEQIATSIADLWAQVWTLRQLSLGVASALDGGQAPDVSAALVKSLGTTFENTVIEVARDAAGSAPFSESSRFKSMLDAAVLAAPGFTIRGGTNEILRGVIARSLGVR